MNTVFVKLLNPIHTRGINNPSVCSVRLNSAVNTVFYSVENTAVGARWLNRSLNSWLNRSC
jgi:hypothetical protein